MKRAAWWATAATLAGLATTHFVLVVLSVLPLNPLSFALQPVIAAYVHPLFTQNWNLFAPVPVSSDYIVYARGYPAAPSGAPPSDWVPINEPLLAAVRHNRLSPLNLPLTVLSKATSAVYEDAQPTSGANDSRETRLAAWTDPVRRPRGLVVLESAGAAALHAAFPAQPFAHVQILLVVRGVPSFSDRDTAPAVDSAVTDTVLFHPSPFPAVATWPGAS